MKRFLGLLMIILMSCSPAKVITDYDDTMDFNNFKTYGFYKNVGNGLNEIDIKRLLKIIDTTLQKKGLNFNKNPDFFIDFSLKKSMDAPRNTVTVGLGNAGIYNQFGISGAIPIGQKKVFKTILIEFLIPKKERLFWQGSIETKVKQKQTPPEKIIYFQKTIAKILSRYPPQ